MGSRRSFFSSRERNGQAPASLEVETPPANAGEWTMQAPVRTHPRDDQLRLFGIGQMDATEAVVVEEHVASCPVCCQTLKGLASDTLINLLREAVTTPPV